MDAAAARLSVPQQSHSQPRMSSRGSQAAEGAREDLSRQTASAAGLSQARAVADKNHCVSWDTAAVEKPLDRTKEDLMTAKDLDREEGT